MSLTSTPIDNPDRKIKQIAAIADELPGVVVIHRLTDFKLEYISDRGLRQLDVALEELRSLSFEEYHRRYFNPVDAADYVPKIKALIIRNADEPVTFFQQLRMNERSEYKWHLSTLKILSRDEAGRPTHIVTFSCAIDPLHHLTNKVSRLLNENNFLRQQQTTFSSLTKRECDVLKLIVLGKSNYRIAEELFIAETTVESHRKSIKRKLNANSYYDLSKYAHAFDLV
jgi:DNA-binding CsgD family transcriptional regulator